MVQSSTFIQTVFEDTQNLATDRTELESFVQKSKRYFSPAVQGRMCQWLNFFNENFGRCTTTYCNFIEAIFEAPETSELFIDQTQYEFEISQRFLNTLFDHKNFKNCSYIENANYLLMVSVIYGRYAGMQCRTIKEGLDMLSTKITNQEMSKLFAHLFIWYENPVILTNSLPALTMKEIELLMFLLKGNSIRKFPNLPVTFSRLESYHFMFGFSDQFQLTSHVLSRAAFMTKLMAVSSYNGALYNFCTTSRSFTYSIDKALAEIDFWKDVYRIFSSEPKADFSFLQQYLEYVEYMKEQKDVAFSLKGATLKSMRRRVGEWHREMSMLSNQEDQELKWLAQGQSTFEVSHMNGHYLFKQLVSGEELYQESKELKHCVFSYAKTCSRGEVTIWSMSKKFDMGTKKLLTIEVRNNTVCQVAGEHNRKPTSHEEKILAIWTKAKKLEYLVGGLLE
jgi:hypothetical protein